MAAITDDPARGRFEMPTEAGPAFVVYRRTGDVLALTHAEVPPALEGKGVGSVLVKGVLEQIRERGEKARPICPFIVHYMRRHPEFQDIAAD